MPSVGGLVEQTPGTCGVDGQSDCSRSSRRRSLSNSFCSPHHWQCVFTFFLRQVTDVSWSVGTRISKPIRDFIHQCDPTISMQTFLGWLNWPQVVRLLILAGVDPNGTGRYGRTPLQLVSWCQTVPMEEQNHHLGRSVTV